MRLAPMDREKRTAHNERFLQRLLARRPQDRETYARLLRAPTRGENAAPESTLGDEASFREKMLETIVSRERPVLFVKDGGFDTLDVAALGNEAVELIQKVKDAAPDLRRVLPLIG